MYLCVSVHHHVCVCACMHACMRACTACVYCILPGNIRVARTPKTRKVDRDVVVFIPFINDASTPVKHTSTPMHINHTSTPKHMNNTYTFAHLFTSLALIMCTAEWSNDRLFSNSSVTIWKQLWKITNTIMSTLLWVPWVQILIV